ncbi:MAG: AAA family ATPase [Saprospiraceae bacterium]|jgi:DNA helicase-2/ATP-dependent DNA helicase PcrA|nr:AAA family ATPase [Saprospiraceae bacterium]
MDKRIILAVAGSGKTYHIVEKLDETKRVLLITYTTNNTENLRKAIIAKFGYLPNNIKIKSYFTFLYSFCFKPFLANDLNSKGIFWKYPPDFTRNLKRSDDKFYLLKEKWLYHNRIAKLIIEKKILSNVKERLEKYYDCLFIDEIQDFGGHDFNLLIEISKSKLDILFVGDFYQHTFSTSNDGNTNINLYNNSDDYLQKFRVINFAVDNSTLLKSRRCSKTICDFVREQVGIEIFSHHNNITKYQLITDEIEADKIFNDNKIVKLFLSEHFKYSCNSDNWGSCKGLEFEDVCVVINDETLKLYNSNKLSILNPTTKNKFYVACSRTKNNLYFVPMKLYKKYKKTYA